MVDDFNIRRMDVDTPCGGVHVAAFPKGGEGVPPHREVIFKILSDYIGTPVTAGDLILVESESASGTPRPTFPKLDFDVNWTHSGRECVVAYGPRHSLKNNVGLHLGVDMEVHSPKHLRVAKRFYSPRENTYLESLDENLRQQEFYRLWCRKEALFKCVGGSFFEGSVSRDVLDNPQPDRSCLVHFVDLPWDGPASLCIAVTTD
ncbi:4'-phosphopantetheinyl transferase superfamily protein [Fibrobacter sp. UWEL]|nr:4'-phosphopantetheinyl transferase superfamily protein [Fibrobacter sp. UWEL]